MTRDTRLEAQFADLAYRIAELERRARNRKRTGTVAVVDHAKGKARVQISDENGKPYLGPWMPWKEVAAGGIKTHVPPTVGEQVDVVSESGDLTDGVIDMSIPSDANPRPHDGPEAVITKGATRITIGDDVIEMTATKLKVTADVEIVGDVKTTGTIFNNGHSIGSDHLHTDVMPGGGLSGPPQ